MDNQNENTKEIENLEQLREKALDTLELDLDIIEDMDENIEESTEIFENIVEETKELEEQEKEAQAEEEPKKKRTFKEKINDMKAKWQSLPKKKKIVIIVTTSLVLLLIIGIILYFVLNKEEESTPKVKDVIVDLDNYRYKNGKLIFLNKSKEEIGEYTCQNQDQDLCYVAYYIIHWRTKCNF